METTSIMFDNKSFLSNYYECPVRIGSYIYPSSENAYHSFKFDNIWLHHHICEILQKVTPDEAKHFVRELKKYYKPDWENCKKDAMYIVVKEKFKQNLNLRAALISTGDAILVEDTTTWHDNFWGDCTCPQCQYIMGQNNLGKILMKVRKELQNNI